MIELILPGTPLSWRAPFVGSRGAFSVRTPIVGQMKALLRHFYKGSKIQDAICLDAIFVLPIPKSYSKKKRSAMLSGEILPTVHKDRSNMLKFVEDVLQGIVFEDDCQIIDGRCCKRYGEDPQTLIRIYDPKEYWDKFGGLC